MKENALQQVESQQMAVVTPMDMLRMAVEKGADLDKLQQLMGLQERWEANEAKKAYVTAMNAFKADPPEVFKSKHVSFETSKGITAYNHALLDEAVAAIGSGLSKHGLSFRWDCEQLEAMIRVTCIITHVQGHSEKTWLQSGADQSGGKNNIQAIGSTVTYLQRYTLFAATGLAAKGMDDDGGGSEKVFITEQQAADLKALAEEVEADVPKFLEYLGKKGKVSITAFSEIPANMHHDAVAALEQKRKK